jgi:predicted O-methyltransferase YrrM
MPRLRTLLTPSAYVQKIRRWLESWRLSRDPNRAGTLLYPPGHFYSPLLDIATFGRQGSDSSFDGSEYWEHVGLDAPGQKAFYSKLLDALPNPPFPPRKTPEQRYYYDNGMFGFADAFTLSAIIRTQRPARIVEVGSGFSSAVMLDTRDAIGLAVSLTFIEPNADRLYSLLTERDRSTTIIHINRVQEIPLTVFDDLQEGDILFIDSSHVAKVGSDVTFLLLRVLPRLRAGVIVHVHDIFYPKSYPESWIRQGRAWNESIVLRAFLSGNGNYEVIAFNSFAAAAFPELFHTRLPAFLVNQRSGEIDMGAGGASIWVRKRS